MNTYIDKVRNFSKENIKKAIIVASFVRDSLELVPNESQKREILILNKKDFSKNTKLSYKEIDALLKKFEEILPYTFIKFNYNGPSHPELTKLIKNGDVMFAIAGTNFYLKLETDNLLIEIYQLLKELNSEKSKNKPESKKLNNYSFEWDPIKSRLYLPGKIDILFKEESLSKKLVDIFYKNRGSSWISYEEINNHLGSNFKAEDIRKGIAGINKRVLRETKNEYIEIIEADQKDKDSKKEKKYRWKY